MEGVTDWLVRIGTWGSVLLPGLIVLSFWGGIVWFRMRRRLREMKRHEDEGTIGRASFFQNADLPMHYDFVAHLGTGGPAPTTVGEKVLRPSIGVKLVILGLVGMIAYYATSTNFWQIGSSPPDRETEWIFTVVQVLLPLAALNGILYVFTSEARYDRDVLIVTRFFRRREYRWKSLTRIADGGAYDLVLFFKPGGKAKVLKHSAGIGEFKTFALGQVRKNRMADA
ncbi:MAG: hypothetical protein J0L76_10060 [Rhodobacterales bacterium]|nr:hypothetical protein [Rhodobacterales bacterium]